MIGTGAENGMSGSNAGRLFVGIPFPPELREGLRDCAGRGATGRESRHDEPEQQQVRAAGETHGRAVRPRDAHPCG